MNRYPNVFVHGFGGWGEDEPKSKLLGYWGVGKRDVLPHLRAQGYECYSPFVGPVNSIWDRSCELWAYLFGGTVDYGKVHSETYGHDRYGRTYAHGVLEDLGKTEAHKKMNLFGHSFGGPTVKLFADLMVQGSEEERAGTDPADLSPLFAGGHGHLIHSVNTLSGVNNGTTFDMFSEPVLKVLTGVVLTYMTTIGNTLMNFYTDPGLEQWGIGEYKGSKKIHGPALLKSLPGMRKYMNSTWDTGAHEMMVPYQKQVNDHLVVDPGIYYFAHRADCTKPFIGEKRIPDKSHTSMLCTVTGIVTGLFLHPRLKGDKTGYHVDGSWYPNDGFVNVKGQSAPLNLPSVEAAFGDELKPGIWHNMEIVPLDHVSWINLATDPEQVFAYYDRMLKTLSELP